MATKEASSSGGGGSRKKSIARKEAPTYYDPKKFWNLDCYNKFKELYDEGKLLDSYALCRNSVQELGLDGVVEKFRVQNLSELLFNEEPGYLDEVCQFYANLVDTTEPPNSYDTMVNGKVLNISKWTINEVLGCPLRGDADVWPEAAGGPLNIYFRQTWPEDKSIFLPFLSHRALGQQFFGKGRIENYSADKCDISDLSNEDRILYEMVHRTLVPTSTYVTQPTITTIMLFYYLVKEVGINPGHAIIEHISTAKSNKKPPRKMPYGSLITKIIKSKYPDMVFTSEPQPCKLYDKNYLENHDWCLVDGKWIEKPPADKSKRPRSPGEEGNERGDVMPPCILNMYMEMKEKISEVIQRRKDTHRARKALRALRRAEAGSSSAQQSDPTGHNEEGH